MGWIDANACEERRQGLEECDDGFEHDGFLPLSVNPSECEFCYPYLIDCRGLNVQMKTPGLKTGGSQGGYQNEQSFNRLVFMFAKRFYGRRPPLSEQR